jgi:hypothetical protein
MKTCYHCKLEKPLSEYHRQAAHRDGLSNYCKPCKSALKKVEYEKNKPAVLKKMAAYRAANPEKVSAAKKKCYLAKPEQYKAKGRANYMADPKKASEQSKAWREKNRERYEANNKAYYAKHAEKRRLESSAYQKAHMAEKLVYFREYRKKRAAVDPVYALGYVVRRRISFAISKAGYKKGHTTEKMLGCDWPTLKAHLESQFRPGMTWGNRGQWHIDHIVPLASAKTEAGLLALCHYTNLQPLWALDNLSKGAKMPEQWEERCVA